MAAQDAALRQITAAEFRSRNGVGEESLKQHYEQHKERSRKEGIPAKVFTRSRRCPDLRTLADRSGVGGAETRGQQTGLRETQSRSGPLCGVPGSEPGTEQKL